VKPEISEFSYGYAVTEGMIRRYSSGLRAAPIFPSLFQEGQAGGGYDVLIQRRGVPLFLQFKLSECMVRSTALEVKQGKLTPPFYRMHFRPPPSDQHELLLRLESSGEQVYYIAPMFHTEEEFDVAYLSGNILKRLIFLRPSAIGTIPDSRRHHVAFQDRAQWWFCSDPKEGHEPTDEETMERALRRAVREDGRGARTRESWEQLAGKLVSLVAEVTGRSEGMAAQRLWELDLVAVAAPQMHPVERVSYLARAFLEAECMVVWEST